VIRVPLEGITVKKEKRNTNESYEIVRYQTISIVELHHQMNRRRPDGAAREVLIMLTCVAQRRLQSPLKVT
jgi:hypothetical protein